MERMVPGQNRCEKRLSWIEFAVLWPVSDPFAYIQLGYLTDSFVKNLRRRGTTVCDNVNPRNTSWGWTLGSHGGSSKPNSDQLSTSMTQRLRGIEIERADKFYLRDLVNIVFSLKN